MVLNSLSENRINIAEFSSPPPEVSETDPGRPFNPETEIDPTMIQDFVADFEAKNKPGNEVILMTRAISFKRLFPNKINELNLEQIWSYCLAELDEANINSLPDMMHFAETRELFPDRFDEVLQVLEKNGLNKTKLKRSFIHTIREAFDETEFAFVLSCYHIKIAFPEVDILKELGYSFTEMEEYLLEYMQKSKDKTNTDIRDVLALVENCRIAFPKEAQGEINLTSEDWSELRDILDRYRIDGEKIEYISLAEAMTLSAAESVNVTEQGIEIIMPHKQASLADPTPDFPAERTF
jgi:hypothetical protein